MVVQILTNGFDDYLRDESNVAGGRATVVALPVSFGEVVEFVRQCAQRKTKLTVSGARTGIVGGAVPFGGAVLSMERMNAIKEFVYEPFRDEWRVKLEPGVLLSDLQQCIQAKTAPDGRIIQGMADFQNDRRRFFFPVDATESSASIGGITATNASGARSFGYGPARAYVRALQVVLSDSDVVNLRRGENRTELAGKIRLTTALGKNIFIPAPHYPMPRVKHTAGFYNSPGLDVIDLFVGSEGLLGVIVEIELALMAEPEIWFGGLAFFPGEREAVQFVRRVRDSGIITACRPVALEYFDSAALQLFNGSGQRKELQLPEIPAYGRAAIFFEQGCRESEMEIVYEAWEKALDDCGSSFDDVWSAADPKNNLKLKRMRHLVPEAVNRIVSENRRRCPTVHKVGTDLAVPNPYLDDLIKVYRERLAEEQIPAVIFGHIGNNNLHVNMLPGDEISLKKAKSLHLEWAKWAVERGGTVIAEHGIGKIKGELLKLLYSETELAEMRAVKQALDPGDLLGPGHGIIQF
jgi:D-lactate dehydrogenase (cytochrome)